MSVLTLVASLVTDAALGVWLGTMTFFSFVAAPKTFDVLDRESAGSVVNAIFPTYYVVGVATGTLAVAATVVRGVAAGFEASVIVVVVATGFATLTAAYARWVLIPKMDAAGADAFEQYHRQSVILNGLAIGGVALSLVAAHL